MRREDETEIVVGGSTNELRVFVEARGKVGNMQKVVTQTYDRKMRQIKELATKEEVLEKCQDLLVTRTLEYMNLTGEIEAHHLKALQRLNQIIDKKDFALFERERQIRDLKAQIEAKDETIETLNGEIEALKLKVAQNKAEYEQKNRQLIEKHDKEVLALKSKEQELIDKTEQDRRSLFKKIDAANRKTEQTQLEMTLIGQNRDKEINEAVERKVLEIETKHERIVSGLERQIKALETTLQKTTVKLNEVRNNYQRIETTLQDIRNRRERFIVVKTKQVTVKPTPPPPPPPSSPPPQSPLKFELRTNMETPKITPRIQPKKMTNRETQCYIPPKSAQKSPIIQPQPQAPPAPPPMQLQIQLKAPTSTFEIATEIADGEIASPVQNHVDIEKLTEKLAELQESLTNTFNMEKSALIKQHEQNVRHLQQQFLVQYEQAYKVVQQNQAGMQALHREQLAVENDRYEELEKLFSRRPSRQEDIDYIKTLTGENLQLAGLCAETNNRLMLSYEALRNCQQDFEKYRKSFPMDLKGVGEQTQSQDIRRASTLKSQEGFTNMECPTAKRLKRLTEPSYLRGRIDSPVKFFYRANRRSHDYKKTEDQVIQEMMQSIILDQQRPPRRVHTSSQSTRRRIL